MKNVLSTFFFHSTMKSRVSVLGFSEVPYSVNISSGCMRARGTVVGWVTMLQAGRSRVRVLMRWNFSSFQPHYGPGVDSAFNRNEYQEPSWGVKGGRRLRLTTLPPSVGQLSRYCGTLNISTTLWASMACYRDSFTFTLPSSGCRQSPI
jgi:hypothetical protein